MGHTVDEMMVKCVRDIIMRVILLKREMWSKEKKYCFSEFVSAAVELESCR